MPATCEIDIAGLVKGASKGEGLAISSWQHPRMRAIIHVIRCFDDDNVVRRAVSSCREPVEDREVIDTELQLKDLETIESQISKQQKIAAGNKDAKVAVDRSEAYKGSSGQDRTPTVAFDSKRNKAWLTTCSCSPNLCSTLQRGRNAAKTGNEYTKKIEEIAREEGAEMLVIAAKPRRISPLWKLTRTKNVSRRTGTGGERAWNRLIKRPTPC